MLNENPGFFHNFVCNVSTMGLSHSLRLLSESILKCDHNVPRGFFSKQSQWNLNVVSHHVFCGCCKSSSTFWSFQMSPSFWWYILSQLGLNPWLSKMMICSCSLVKQLSCWLVTWSVTCSVTCSVTWLDTCSVTWPWLITLCDPSCDWPLSFYLQLHFWLDTTLPYLSIFIPILPSIYKHGLCTWSVHILVAI